MFKKVSNFLRSNFVLILILLGAFFVRVINVGYQVGSNPDERAIVMISEGVLNGNLKPQNYHYGNLIYYQLAGISYLFKSLSKFSYNIFNSHQSATFFRTLGESFNYMAGYDGAFYIGRTLAILSAVLAVLFLYLLVEKMFNKRVALIAAFLLAFNPFYITISRYYITDVLVTCFFVACAYFIYNAILKNSYKSFLLAFVCFAFAFAYKVSSAYALIALLYMCFVFTIKNEKGGKEVLFYFLIPFAISFLIIFLSEPYAFIEFARYKLDNMSQVDMVRGKNLMPYTRQYLDTTPFLYHLKQMFFYTIRPLSFIACFLGIFLVLFNKTISKFNKVFLFLFIAPCFLQAGSSFVKFPRYILMIYPFILVFGAYAFSKINFKPKFLKNLLLTIFFFIIFIEGVDCITLYFKEHSYIHSSRWVYKNIPRESTILGVHWDDKMPVTVPNSANLDAQSHRYKYHDGQYDLNLYEESNDVSLHNFIDTLLKGDYIILPADRILRGILDKFDQKREYSIKILQGLFDSSNPLGYKLVYVNKPRTLLGNLGLYNDDLADESLVGYDHPKVFVFKKIKPLSYDEIKQGIFNIKEKRILEDVLTLQNYDYSKDSKKIYSNKKKLSSNDEEIPLAKKEKNKNSFFVMNSFFAVIFWLIIIDALSIYILPFLFSICKFLPDKGIGIFRCLGLILFSFVVWILGCVLKVKITQEFLLCVLIFLYALSFLYMIARKISFKDLSFYISKDAIKIECVYFIIFFLFATYRFLHPEIVWGEKTMDFGFLNYFKRLEALPPMDPWSYGNKLAYYFYGYFIFGLVHKISSFPTNFGFNLSIATIASILATSLITIIFYLKNSLKTSIFFSLSILLLTNFEKFYIYFFDKHKEWQLGFDLFWKTSRVHEYYSNAITEYPFWSLIFADLHPHLMAMPIFVCVCLFLISMFKEKTLNFCFYILFSITSVVLFMTNMWDAMTIFSLGVVFFIFMFIKSIKENDLDKISSFVTRGVIFTILALIFAYPFYIDCVSENKSSFGWVQGSELHAIYHVIRHFGFWILCIVLGFLFNIKDVILEVKNNKKYIIFIIFALIFSLALPICFSLCSTFVHDKRMSWGIQLISSLLMFISLLNFKKDNYFISSVFLFTFACLLSFTEMVFVIDRSNTIFKFYIGMWFFIGFACIPYVKNSFNNFYYRWIFGTLFLVCAISSCISYIKMSMHTYIGDEKIRPTLNGTKFLKSKKKDLLKVVSYLNKNVKGTPVLLETYGASYITDTTIPYQKYTGLPVLLGWEHHISQRGTSREDIAKRKGAIDAIYKTQNDDELKALLKEYNIKLIIVGRKEREKYSEDELKKFDEKTDIFTKLYSSNDEKVYAVTQKINLLFDE